MIATEIPVEDLPRYVHPETGAPWFACPRCAGLHVRGRHVFTEEFRLHGLLGPRADGGWCMIPRSDRAVDLHSGRPGDQQECAEWLECASCGNAFRADGQPVAAVHLPRTWHVVETAEALASLGINLVEALDAEVDSLLDPLRSGLPLGAGVYVLLDELRVANGPRLDEPLPDGTSGVHVHPRNYAMGTPAWCVAPFTDDEQWPEECCVNLLEYTRLAYSFDPDSLPLGDNAGSG